MGVKAPPPPRPNHRKNPLPPQQPMAARVAGQPCAAVGAHGCPCGLVRAEPSWPGACTHQSSPPCHPPNIPQVYGLMLPPKGHHSTALGHALTRATASCFPPKGRHSTRACTHQGCTHDDGASPPVDRGTDDAGGCLGARALHAACRQAFPEGRRFAGANGSILREEAGGPGRKLADGVFVG